MAPTRNRYSRSRAERRRRQTLASTRRLMVEPLENRILLATLTVDTRFDLVDAADNRTSLREAIMAAESADHPGRDTIRFDPALSFETILIGVAGFDATGTAVASPSSQFVITEDVTIDASQARLVRIGREVGDENKLESARLLHGVFKIESGEVELSNVVVQRGLAADGEYGGGIWNNGHLTLRNSIVGDNEQAISAQNVGGGGGIYNAPSGTLTLINTTVGSVRLDAATLTEFGLDPADFPEDDDGQPLLISGNAAEGPGGGIYNEGNIRVASQSSVAFNRSVFDMGGGIFNSGDLTLAEANVEDNLAREEGGGIYNSAAGIIHIESSSIRRNRTSFGNGGGISNNTGALHITTSTIEENRAGGTNQDNASGGGIATIGTATISQSTINDNSAQRDGGAIRVGFPSNLIIDNTTISHNETLAPSAAGKGGGLHVIGDVALHQVTIVDNVSAGSSGGGGFYQESSGTITISNSIVANNRRENTTSSGQNGRGVINSLGYNLFEDTDQFSGVQPNDIIDAATGIGVLADNGGPTLTHGLLPSSPAVNAGDPGVSSGTDQRGEPRVVGPRVDIGAFESQPPRTLRVDNLEDVVDGNYGPGEFTLREALLWAAQIPGRDTIGFSSVLVDRLEQQSEQDRTFVELSNEILIDDDVRIHGPGSNLLTISGDDTTRIFSITPGANVHISGITLTHGNQVGGSGGGAIQNDGILTLKDTVVSNSRSNAGGGGISNGVGGSLTLDSAYIHGNRATGSSLGGGIANRGAIVLRGSTIANNYTDTNGAGIYNGVGATLNAVNTTISSNESGAAGGGVFVDSSGRVDLAYVTITNNRTSQNSLSALDGGGLQLSGSAAVSLNNSLVAGNVSNTGFVPSDLVGNVDQGAFNLIGVGGNLNNGLEGNLVAIGDARLGPLRSVDGAPPTHALRPDSPAIDRADAADFPRIDQRGLQREPQSPPDIGAYEFASPNLPNPIVVDTISGVSDGVYEPGGISLGDAIAFANASVAHNEIVFDARLFGEGAEATAIVNLTQEVLVSARASSSRSGSFALPPENAFDGDLGTPWFTDFNDAANKGETPFLEAEFLGDVTVTGITLRSARDPIDADFLRGRFEVFDAAGFLLYTSDVDLPDPNLSPSKRDFHLDIPDQTGARRVRFTSLEDQSDSNGLAELEIYGTAAGVIALGDEEIVVTSDLTITGPGAHQLQLSGQRQNRILQIGDAVHVTISGMSITNGRLAPGTRAAGDRDGGAILNHGDLTLREVYVAASSAEDVRGNDGGRGGAIFNSSGATLNLIGSTLVGNSSMRSGGALYNEGHFNSFNSTFSNNRAIEDEGAAIFNAFHNDPGSSTLSYTTITGNRAGRNDENIGGIYNEGRLTIDNTIIAQNGAAPFFGQDGETRAAGTVISNGNNFVGSNGDSNTSTVHLIANPIASDQIGLSNNRLDPKLTDLASIGGSMPMHGLLPTSDAIAAGAVTAAGATDQRGAPRPPGEPTDIGAFELDLTSFSWDTQIIVDSFTDVLDGDYSEGHLTLREALAWANARDGELVSETCRCVDKITFRKSFVEDLAAGAFGTNTLVLNGKQLEITDDIQIVDPGSVLDEPAAGANIFRISGDEKSRVLHIGPNATVEIAGLTFADGRPPSAEAFRDGAGIWSEGNLTLVRSIVEDNFADTGGGGIYFEGGSLIIHESTIRGNETLSPASATGVPGGAGILNVGGELHIDASTISHNLAGGIAAANNVSAAPGGGIYHAGTMATITASTIFLNQATRTGGGIQVGRSAQMFVFNSTISGNITGGSDGSQAGAGIFNSGQLEIHHSTIVDNSAQGDTGGVKSLGVGSSVALRVFNSIVGMNLPDNRPDIDALGTFESGFNVFGSVPTALPIDSTDQVALPEVGPLGDNGGPTLTHVLKPNSPAIDAANPLIKPDPTIIPRMRLTDQRGRPLVDIPDLGERIPDIGAYEIQSLGSSRWTYEAEDRSQFSPDEFFIPGVLGAGDALVYGFGFDDGRANSNIRPEPLFLGFEFDTGPLTFGKITKDAFGAKFGGEVNADFSGKMGLDLGFYINSGSVDVGYDGNLNYVIDTFDQGATTEATISTFLEVVDGSIYTISPKIAGYADLIMQLDANVDAIGCLVGCVGAELLDVSIDHVEEMLSINRQDKDEFDRPAFFLGGELDPEQLLAGDPARVGTPLVLDRSDPEHPMRFFDLLGNLLQDPAGTPISDPPVTPALDGDVRYFSLGVAFAKAIRDELGLQKRIDESKDLQAFEDALRDFNNAESKLERYREEIEREQEVLRLTHPPSSLKAKLAREALRRLGGNGAANGGQPDGGKYKDAERAKADAESRRKSAEDKLKAKVKEKLKQKLIGPKALIGISSREAEGSLLGGQIDLEAGIGIGILADVTKNIGSMQLTLPDINLSDTSTDSRGRLSASTDSFPDDSELDFKRQFAQAELDLAGVFGGLLGPVGTLAGAYRVTVAGLELEITTAAYNFGPQWNITQDVSAEPALEGVTYEFFTADAQPDDEGNYREQDRVSVPVKVNGEFVADASPVQRVDFDRGDRVTVVGNGDPILVLPTMHVDTVFSNDIGWSTDWQGRLEAFGINFSAFGVPIVQVGPLINHQETLDRVDNGEFYNETFKLHAESIQLEAFKLFDQMSDGTTAATALMTEPSVTPDPDESQLAIEQTPVDQPVYIMTEMIQPGENGQLDQLFSELHVHVTGPHTELAAIDQQLTVIPPTAANPDLYIIRGFTDKMLAERSSVVFAVMYSAETSSTITATRVNANTIASLPNTNLGNVAQIDEEAVLAIGEQILIANDLDIDGDGAVSPLTDGLLLLRYLSGFAGNQLIDQALASGATRTTPREIINYIERTLDHEYFEQTTESIFSTLDFDGSGGTPDGSADGTLFVRHLARFNGEVLVEGLDLSRSIRRTGSAVTQFLDTGRFAVRDEFTSDFESVLDRTGSDIFGLDGVLDPDPGATAGSSPSAPRDSNGSVAGASARFAAGPTTRAVGSTLDFVLESYGQEVTYEDLLLNGTLVSHVADGSPMEFGTEEFRDRIDGGLADGDVLTMETGTALLGTEEPIFVRAPDASAYQYEALDGFGFESIAIDPQIGGNVFLNTAFDLFLFNEATSRWEFSALISSHNPEHVGPKGYLRYTFPEGPVTEFRLYSFPLVNKALHDSDNLASAAFETTTGFILTGGTGTPTVRMTELAPRLTFSTPASLSVDFPVHSTDQAAVTSTFTVTRSGANAETTVSTSGDGAVTTPESLLMTSAWELPIRGNDSVQDTLVIDHSNGPLRVPIRFSGGFRDDTVLVSGSGTTIDLVDRNEISTDLPQDTRIALADAVKIKLSEVETVDIRGNGNNRLFLDVDAVIANDPTSGQMLVRGDVDDTVDIGVGWILVGTTTIDGSDFDEYAQGSATLYLEDAITTQSSFTSSRASMVQPSSRYSNDREVQLAIESPRDVVVATFQPVSFASAAGAVAQISSQAQEEAENALERQVVTSSPSQATAGPNSRFEITLGYTTTSEMQTTGLHLRIHFDSSMLTLNDLQDVLSDGLPKHQLLDDACFSAGCGGLDGDPATDKYLNLLWLDSNAGAAWPSTPLPVDLLTASFTTAPSFDSETAIRFSGSAAANFTLEAAPVTVARPSGELDFGDAPTAAQSGFAASYPTTINLDGARHSAGSLFLGAAIDVEVDGQPTTAADGDDLADQVDEDGVSVFSSIVATGHAPGTASFAVVASDAAVQNGFGKLDAWIDFNQDGDWLDQGEQIFASKDLVAGLNLLSFDVPVGATPGSTGARFRLSSGGGLDPTGAASDGEVEDYIVVILHGDAPGGAPVTIESPSAGSLDVAADGDDVVVRSGEIEVFRSPGALVNRLSFFSLEGDVTLNVADVDAIFRDLVAGNTAAGNDTLRLTGSNQFLDLTNSTNSEIRGFETIDISGSGDNTLTLGINEVIAISPTTDTLRIVHNDGDVVNYGNGWTVEIPQITGGQYIHVLTQGIATLQVVNSLPYQNPLLSLDTNRDKSVSPLDALIIINRLNTTGPAELSTPTSVDGLTEFFYIDTNGDRFVAPVDVIRVVNFLNDPTRSLESESVFSGFDLEMVDTLDEPTRIGAADQDGIESQTSGPAMIRAAIASGVSPYEDPVYRKRDPNDTDKDLVAAIDAFFSGFDFGTL